jgi:hypothetical protein
VQSYKIKVFPKALTDIQEITEWYNKQSSGLGIRCQKQVISQINKLNKRPLVYIVRYTDVRCMLIKKFPFMVHFLIENGIVVVFAVLHMSRNPIIWDVLRERE